MDQTDLTSLLHISLWLRHGESGGGGIMGFYDSYFCCFLFFLIAPQRKKQKQHQKMINALEKGDNVKTIGGVFGK